MLLFIGVTNMSYVYSLLYITTFIGWLIGLMGNGCNNSTDPGSTKISVPSCFWLDSLTTVFAFSVVGCSRPLASISKYSMLVWKNLHLAI